VPRGVGQIPTYAGDHQHSTDAKFFEEVAQALAGTYEILIIGAGFLYRALWC
jgi:hypothetical protein